MAVCHTTSRQVGRISRTATYYYSSPAASAYLPWVLVWFLQYVPKCWKDYLADWIKCTACINGWASLPFQAVSCIWLASNSPNGSSNLDWLTENARLIHRCRKSWLYSYPAPFCWRSGWDCFLRCSRLIGYRTDQTYSLPLICQTSHLNCPCLSCTRMAHHRTGKLCLLSSATWLVAGYRPILR